MRPERTPEQRREWLLSLAARYRREAEEATTESLREDRLLQAESAERDARSIR